MECSVSSYFVLISYEGRPNFDNAKKPTARAIESAKKEAINW